MTTSKYHYNHLPYNEECNRVPDIENGHMACIRLGGGKKCTPVCKPDHQFYQKFSSRPPTYICNSKRVDWKIRRFIPDCSPVFKNRGRGSCRSGWESRSNNHTCIACPPGMYRKYTKNDKLCQLCPKGYYASQFGSSQCMKCQSNHTTKGLGSRRGSSCYYQRKSLNLFERRRGRKEYLSHSRKKNTLGFRYYSSWMKPMTINNNV